MDNYNSYNNQQLNNPNVQQPQSSYFQNNSNQVTQYPQYQQYVQPKSEKDKSTAIVLITIAIFTGIVTSLCCGCSIFGNIMNRIF